MNTAAPQSTLTPYSPTTINIVVMAKPAIPGKVKTRLIGNLSPQQAAQVHTSMLRCVLERSRRYITSEAKTHFVLAIDHSPTPSAPTPAPSIIGAAVPQAWQITDQGQGDLGQRLQHVWEALNGTPVVFLGVDTPDLPAEALASILPALESADVAVGPVDDGGYWTLAARVFEPALLSGIDWGTPNVYHQTLAAANRTGRNLAALAPWYDVDGPADLEALRERINRSDEPALAQLRLELDCIFSGRTP